MWLSGVFLCDSQEYQEAECDKQSQKLEGSEENEKQVDQESLIKIVVCKCIWQTIA